MKDRNWNDNDSHGAGAVWVEWLVWENYQEEYVGCHDEKSHHKR